MMVSLHVVPQKRWRLIHIYDQHVEITIIIKITERTATTGVPGGKPGPTLGYSLKTSISQISQGCSRTLVRILRKLFFKLRINAARNEEYIWPAIVIEIDNSGAPTDIRARRP